LIVRAAAAEQKRSGKCEAGKTMHRISSLQATSRPTPDQRVRAPLERGSADRQALRLAKTRAAFYIPR